MPLTYSVPRTVQKTAQAALEAHRRSEGAPVGVQGIKAAEALSSGHVPIDLVAKVARYFVGSERSYTEAVQLHRTEANNAVMRSWSLHGGEPGRKWASKAYRAAVREGLIQGDPLIPLLSMRPEDVYLRFALDGWRYEYDLTPAKAALFVEQYQLATGLPLDLGKAFGESAKAVGNAIYRRYHTPNPFKEAYKALLVRDTEYRRAASIDLGEMVESIGHRQVDEAIFPKAHVGSHNTVAKMVWGTFVAYCILAVEAPDILKEMNDEALKPPNLNQAPKNYTHYHDAINTFIAYFHPQGKRYVDPEADKKFTGIDADMSNLMHQSYHGKKIFPTKVQRLLGRARRWTTQNKMGGSLFHIFIVDWKKGNWQHILDNMPLDADVRPYFEKFVKDNPPPKEGT